MPPGDLPRAGSGSVVPAQGVSPSLGGDKPASRGILWDLPWTEFPGWQPELEPSLAASTGMAGCGHPALLYSMAGL